MTRVWTMVGVLALALMLMFYPLPGPDADESGGFDFDSAGKIPVVDGGRVKPLNAMAEQVMLMVSDKRQYTDAEGNYHPALRWMLDAMTVPLKRTEAYAAPVFRIDNEDVIDALGMAPRDGYRYALDEMQPALEGFYKQVEAAAALEEDQRSLFQNKALELSMQLDLFNALRRWHIPLAVPPLIPGTDWRTPIDVAAHRGQAGGTSLPLDGFAMILNAWAEQDVDRFNQLVTDYRAELSGIIPDESKRAAIEDAFIGYRPFARSAALYVLAFGVVCIAWLFGLKSPLLAGRWLIVLTLVLHTVALGVRMWLQGRPPVTNLYSSAIFIGWGSVVLGMILEWFYRNGVGTLSAAVLGFMTLVVAINLELQADGETLEMMQAVLDTNFWLATHVTTITIGYSSTFLAGLLGIIYILRGVFTPSLNAGEAQSLSRMIYGIICFSLLFSFVGTVLGGVWADQSWGRFWGWDPKENGALIIVLWNALILHARWGGMIRQRGIAVMAIFGNIVTAWSWFGTNMLGVGLHSYGFMDSALFWMLAFVASQLTLMAIGLIPLKQWRSTTLRQPKTA